MIEAAFHALPRAKADGLLVCGTLDEGSNSREAGVACSGTANDRMPGQKGGRESGTVRSCRLSCRLNPADNGIRKGESGESRDPSRFYRHPAVIPTPTKAPDKREVVVQPPQKVTLTRMWQPFIALSHAPGDLKSKTGPPEVMSCNGPNDSRRGVSAASAVSAKRPGQPHVIDRFRCSRHRRGRQPEIVVARAGCRALQDVRHSCTCTPRHDATESLSG